MRRFKWYIVSFSLILVVSQWPGQAKADSGVTISPPFQDIAIQSDQSQVAFTYSVTNNDAKEAKIFNLSTSDFGSLNQSGGVVFLGSTPGQLRKYSLVNWLKLAKNQIAVGPMQTVKVQATIQNDQQLAPGGHYGAILLTQQAPPSTDPTKQVQVQSVISTLLFVEKVGGEHFGLDLSKLDTKAQTWRMPADVKLTFANTGNIHVVPRGTVEVVDPTGKVISKGIINEGSGLILPESSRVFTVSLTKLGLVAWPGRYRVLVQYRFDGVAQFVSYSRAFYFAYLPLIIAIGLVVLLVFLMAYVIWKHRLNQSS